MAASTLPWRFEIDREALQEISAAHGNGRPNQNTLLGRGNRDTASNIVNGKTLASNPALATAAMRLAEAEGIEWQDAFARLFKPVRAYEEQAA